MTEDNSPKLPSPIGEVLLNGETTIIHCADAKWFDPLVGWSRPDDIVPPKEPQAPLIEAPVLPISLLPDTSFIPHHYVVHMRTQRCSHCGITHESSVVYAYNSIPSRMGFKPVSHLVPVSRFSYNVPVIVQRLPEDKPTPACHECARSNMDLSHLPRPADMEAFKRILAVNQKTVEPKKAATENSNKQKAKPTKTIDDILNI